MTGELSNRQYRVVRAASVNAPSLSIVVPMFNTEDFVVAAVRSALGQLEESVEVIVVDDGSTDNGLHNVLVLNDPRLTVLSQENRGLSAARNLGILASASEYVGFLDSDDIWHPMKAHLQLEAMRRDPNLGVTFSHSAYLDESGALTGDLLLASCDRPDGRQLARRNQVGNGSNAIVRRTCFQRAGLFDESLRLLEDWDMWVRIAGATPYTFQLLPRVLTGYRIRRESLMMNVQREDRKIEGSQAAMENFRRYLPFLSDRDISRSWAQMYRVFSRRALSRGDIRAARYFYGKAWKRDRLLAIYDVRALCILLILAASAPLPPRVASRLYDAARRVARAFQARRVPQLHSDAEKLILATGGDWPPRGAAAEPA